MVHNYVIGRNITELASVNNLTVWFKSGMNYDTGRTPVWERVVPISIVKEQSKALLWCVDGWNADRNPTMDSSSNHVRKENKRFTSDWTGEGELRMPRFCFILRMRNVNVFWANLRSRQNQGFHWAFYSNEWCRPLEIDDIKIRALHQSQEKMDRI